MRNQIDDSNVLLSLKSFAKLAASFPRPPEMAFLRGPSAPLVRCVLATLLGLSSSAFALEPVAPDEDAIKLDQTIQVLKDEATQLEGDAQAARRKHLFPPSSSVAIYLSNSVRNLLLEEVRLSIDGGEPIVHRYDPFSSRALLVDGALQELALINVERGRHEIELNLSGELAKGDRLNSTYTAIFDKRFDANEIELEILPGKRGGPPAFRVREWRRAGQ